MATRNFTSAWCEGITWARALAEHRKSKPGSKEPTQIDFRQKLERGCTLVLTVGRSTRSWSVTLYDKDRKAYTKTLGRLPAMNLKAAREAALAALAAGGTEVPAIPAEASFAEVAAQWVELRVIGRKLRTGYEIERQLKISLLPAWGTRPITTLRRSHIVELFDRMVEVNGASMADHTFRTVRAMLSWYELRTDGYRSPIPRGMNFDPRSASERARSRTLSDDEVVSFWKACHLDEGRAGALGIVLLTCGQRYTKTARMGWRDVSADGLWIVPREPREKSTIDRVILPRQVRELLEGLPRDGELVFGAKGTARQRLWAIHKHMPAEECSWTWHDLRRSARSRLSRIGVSREIGELALGHALTGVHAVYDRHDYLAEKSEALQRLANHLEDLTAPVVRELAEAA